jgi:hypothetical protein
MENFCQMSRVESNPNVCHWQRSISQETCSRSKRWWAKLMRLHGICLNISSAFSVVEHQNSLKLNFRFIIFWVSLIKRGFKFSNGREWEKFEVFLRWLKLWGWEFTTFLFSPFTSISSRKKAWNAAIHSTFLSHQLALEHAKHKWIRFTIR